ncbi:hypothetical protein GCM10011512_01880 [Tersicoccus solisilvae]|uniref:ATPase AAA-type core domain-containing protein n=1 Tax=Tersicoccus solisilvae TaxID=1882339 RepID=A0ABQ1NJQ5_9MICC|nr:hypothetical protein GCM10011512_01880 [Tersicoccus solisilvae]
MTVELHGEESDQESLRHSTVYFRTAYRHEADFNVQNLTQQPSPLEDKGYARRAVDIDQSVSENYQRLLWQTFSAVYDETTPDNATKAEIRDRLTGSLRDSLQRVFPDLVLTRIGGLSRGRAFEFTKGESRGFPYVNLSAGEKAVFDLLLDSVIKAEYFERSIWCIDEPEVHIGTAAQGLVLRELLRLMPADAQLILASHSLGFMSEAVKISAQGGDGVAFLDFGSHDFDKPVRMTPVRPSREFWKRNLVVAMDDIATLVAPRTVVMCEGSGDGFDAQCYRQIFSAEYPDTDFVSVGNSSDAQLDKLGLTSTLQTIVEGTNVIRLRDRDLASESEVAEWRGNGTRVLSRRHIEGYLFDQEVLDALCDRLGVPEAKTDLASIRLRRMDELAGRGKDPDDVKSAAGPMYTDIRKRLSLGGAGTTARAFAIQHLAPLIRPPMRVYKELKADLAIDS